MGLESANPYSAAADATSGFVNAVTGFIQKGKGSKIIKRLGDSPDMFIPNEVLQNQKIAEHNANLGLPQEQYNQAMRNLQRNQMVALRNAGDRRGGLASVAATQQAMNDAVLNLDVANAKARLQNQNTLFGVNSNVANWKNRQWQNNVKDKWDRKYQYGMSLIGAGNQNATTGINQVAGAGLGFASNGGFKRRGGGGYGEDLLRTDSSNYE